MGDVVKKIRLAALQGLLKFFDSSMIPFLKAYLAKEKDESLKGRVAAVLSGNLVAKTNQRQLLLIVYNQKLDLRTRISALTALNNRHKDMKTTGQLIRALQDDKRDLGGTLSPYILVALQKRTKQTFGADPEAWIKWYKAAKKQ